MKPVHRSLKPSHSGRSGFTLIEVMIVAAVIAILASIAYPSYQEQINKARRAEAKAALLKTLQAQEKYYTKFNTYFAFTQATAMGNLPFRAFASDTAATSYYSITAGPCSNAAGGGIDACVLLTATPGGATGGPAFSDRACGSFTVTSAGIRGATGTEGVRCWQ